MNRLGFVALLVLGPIVVPATADEPTGVEAVKLRHDRALVKELVAYVESNPKAEDVEQGYLTVLNKVIEHDWFQDYEGLAKRYLADFPEGSVRPLAQIVATMARAQAGSYGEALASYNILMSGLGSADQVDFAADFAENLANAATSAGEYETARKVYATLMKKFGDESPDVKRKVGEALARLDRVGKDAPTQQVNDVEGKPFKLSDLKGKYVLVDFWATWCSPCLAELPRVRSAYDKYKGKGFEVVGVSLDETKPALMDFVKERKIPWRQIHNAGSAGDLVSEFGVTTIPATFLIDPTGKIVRLELRGPALDRALEALLK